LSLCLRCSEDPPGSNPFSKRCVHTLRGWSGRALLHSAKSSDSKFQVAVRALAQLRQLVRAIRVDHRGMLDTPWWCATLVCCCGFSFRCFRFRFDFDVDFVRTTVRGCAQQNLAAPNKTINSAVNLAELATLARSLARCFKYVSNTDAHIDSISRSRRALVSCALLLL
jgi:hypothetical protein